MTGPGFGALPQLRELSLDAPESDHHSDCPQHPWNDVLDEPEPCECAELRACDEAEAADARRKP